MTPAHERKAKERKARKEAGFVRIEAWIPADKRDAVKAAIDAIASSAQQEPTP